METTRQTLTVEEVAKKLGIGRNQAYEAVRTGKIPSERIGRRYIIPASALKERFGVGDGRPPWVTATAAHRKCDWLSLFLKSVLNAQDGHD